MTVFRPGYIYPAFGRERSYWGDTVMMPLMPFRAPLSKWITDSREVARAVLHCGTGGSVPSPATNRDIIAAAAAYVTARPERSMVRYTVPMASNNVPEMDLPPDPVIEEYKKDIDRTLLRENLKLTPTQRLEKLQLFMRDLAAIRGAARRGR